MANNWEYATLGQRERLSRIRQGDQGVYNSEKGRNKLLKSLQSELGISTKDVDDWDATIDNAYNVSQQNAKKAALPKYASGKYSQINNEMNSTLKSLRNERDEGLANTKAEAQSALEYLEEWLANNGYDSKGKLSVESKKKLGDALESAIKSINEDYEKQVENTKNKYISLVM